MYEDLGRVGIIANPAAQNGEAAKIATRFYNMLLKRYGNDGLELALTTHPGDAIDLAARSSDHFDTLMVMGGDGIVHEAVNGLMSVERDYRPRLGVVPIGSGNDYALTLGVSENPKKALDQILACETKIFDVGRANGEYFAETLSFGLDAAIALDTVERRKHTGLRGTPLYMASGFDQIMHNMRKYEFKAVLHDVEGHGEDVTLDSSSYIFAVQIGPTYGGHFAVCPDADPTDGYFDICIGHGPFNKLTGAMIFLKAKGGKHAGSKQFKFYRAKSLDISFAEEPPCQADGEKMTGTEYSIECVHEAIEVIVGNS